MSEKPENLPAFPHREYETRPWHSGMTLRDYFAAHAPSMHINWLNRQKSPSTDPLATRLWTLSLETKWRFEYADAMLKARNS